MNIYDVYVRTGLHSPTFDNDATEYAFRLARHIADEHSDSLGLDDYDPCDGVIGDTETCDRNDRSVSLAIDDAIREYDAAANTGNGGAR
jgi:hypothetical protein